MGFTSVTEETTQANAINLKMELISKTMVQVSQIDIFLLTDLSSAIQQVYHLEILDNSNGLTETYRLKDALINIDTFASNMLLPLKLEVEINDNIETLDFNISRIDADTSSGSFDNPKYYIYCDNSNVKRFRFRFLKNK